MKFATENKTLESFGSLKETKITISANAKAFRLLFGQIYPDIIKAIVREIFTNAWDAQKNSNNIDSPIEIHSPTKFEPWFSIRDYGVGMSDELIVDIFSKMFESTKDSSNDEAGMFGLGSKTPLGYCDSYNILTTQNGISRFYEIYLNNQGEPIVSLKNEENTGEPNGTLVTLPVKESDFDNFEKNIKHFAIGANTPIKINGEKYKNVMETLYEDNNWCIVDHPSINGVHIRMGCVLYKIDADFLKEKTDYYSYQYKKGFLCDSIIIDFPIGTFDVTGSREDIVYNDESKKIISDTVEHIRTSYIDIVKEKIKKCSNYFEAVNCFRKYYGIINSQFLKLPISKIKWRGCSLIYGRGLTFDKYKKDYDFITLSGGTIKITMKVKSNLEGFSLDKNREIILCKTDTKLIHSRIKNLLETENIDRENIVLIKQKEEGEYDLKKLGKIAYLLGARRVHTLENWDRYPIEKNKKEVKNQKDSFDFQSILSSYYRHYNEEDLEGILYLEAFRGEVVDKRGDFFYNLRRIINIVDITKDIVIINKSDIRLVKKYNMEPAMPYIEKKINDWFDDPKNIKRYCIKKAYNNYGHTLRHIPNDLIIEVLPEYNVGIESKISVFDLDNVMCDINGLTSKHKKYINKQMKSITNRYEKFCNIPLVKYTTRHSISCNVLSEFKEDLKKELKLKGLIK